MDISQNFNTLRGRKNDKRRGTEGHQKGTKNYVDRLLQLLKIQEKNQEEG